MPERLIFSILFRLLFRYTNLRWAFFTIVFLSIPNIASAAPAPSATSTVGTTVTNPVTTLDTTVSALLKDPAGTPTAGTVAFVQTADGYSFLVKNVNDFIYNNDPTPVAFKIISQNTTTKTVQLDALPIDGVLASLSYQLLTTDLNAQFLGTSTPGAITPPDIVAGANGVRIVLTGQAGSNGRAGALFVPPSSGGNGAIGPTAQYPTVTIPSRNISTTNQIGIEVGSLGGDGGDGGDSYLSFWDGQDGGDGGAGGTVIVTNETGYQVSATGTEKHGIFAYSRSGQAGNGGGGFAAPGGGTGGHSSDGGNVTVTNQGTIITSGTGAHGIYGLSVSNNGGDGGSQWGLVGQSGSGGYGGNGGSVDITNTSTGKIYTSGSSAHGILAQSIGGSGGSSGTSGNLILSLQGASDNGGNGGAVTVTNDGLISTTGDYSRGIFAQSIGGGGGAGGTSGGLVALGGSGSNGGNGGVVTVRNNSTGVINTTGIEADGIFAQSIGGSGGSGSNSGGLVAVGGNGSKAGNGQAVTVENYGSITTTKDKARGIVAQSIGGGGGDGGNSGGMVSVGGSGDGGGTGATVTARHGGEITTSGNDATGIFVQSVGGGGGNGGSSGSVSAFVGVAVGGAGGAGGTGGNVDVTLQGKDANTASTLSTSGDRSMGVFAQSVGGGGGNGGGAVQVTGGFGGAVSIAVGGKGGAGGAGGVVTMAKGAGISIIQTDGADATGVVLQSVGGGGGNGGYSVSVAASAGPVSGSLSASIGGSGGTGGTGGTVTVGSFDGNGNLTSTGFNGSILTQGDRSTGFFAQSVGGGGGNGGLAVSAAASASLSVSGSIAIGVGGAGGVAGGGGNVSVGTQGNITTKEDNSTGFLAQSVGGGGGNGGGTVAASAAGSAIAAGSVSFGMGGDAGTGGLGGTVNAATRSGTVSTSGDNSTGIIVQSVGGGGGNGGYVIAAAGAGAGVGAGSLGIGLGGSGGAGSQGGLVRADLQSNVITTGDNSGGILVQSVGGGGGNGGFGVTVTGAGAGVGSGAISVGLGGKAGSGGLGGTVNASSTGVITTGGNNSTGFNAQSVGGGGGNGGFNVSVAGSGAGVGSGAINVGLGGAGGSGGNGGTVTASTATGKVTTRGNDSLGILAQSVGGGGGNGGFNIGVAGSGGGVGSGAINVGLGGNGGSAGNGNTVNLTVRNDVSTGGDNAHAIAAQSIGGGGGNGGFNVSLAGSGAGVGSGAIAVGLGGNGAGGGDGGTVNANIISNIDTAKNNAYGVIAQSLGGGGGNGGFNVSASGSGAGVGSGSVAVGLGGNGSAGGNGKRVDTIYQGVITTKGVGSTAFIAQSLGGGGGNGGFNVSANGSGGGVGSGGVGVGLGGNGAGGGQGGIVVAELTGAIATQGNQAGGIIAQSIGGGGGNGGFNVTASGSGAGVGSGAVSVGLGGKGGGGGSAEAVTLTVKKDANLAISTVTTQGNDAIGILAQSVGGGGGNGGFNVTVAGSGAGVGSGGIAVGLGGGGGTAGMSKAVNVTVANDVGTDGKNSHGIVAQSLGGGGGNGGFNVSVAGSGAGTGSGAIAVGLGGNGAGGGNAGTVTALMTGNIATKKANSFGLLAQSLGGGGGNGGFNVTASLSGAGVGGGAIGVGLGGSGAGGGQGNTVDATTQGTISTEGADSTAFAAQSIGGGGGNGGFNVTATASGAGTGSGAIGVGLGGSGAGGGNGGAVIAKATNTIQTTGDRSAGFFAQSLGGGGGNGGFNVTATGSGAGTGSGAISVGLGGSGGGGGNASTVNALAEGTITTFGKDSTAFTAQSLGGGGGNGAFNVSVTGSGAGTGSGAIGVGLGGSGAGGGNANAVTAETKNTIFTLGDRSFGFLAQSLGGGGGNGGFNVSVTGSGAGTGSGAVDVGLGGSGAGGGNGGTVNAKASGTITTVGNDSTGFAAQSIGGGGGNGAFNVSVAGSGAGTGSGAVSVGLGGSGGGGGTGDKVTASTSANIETKGDRSTGILAQSVGGGGGNGGFNVSVGVSGAKTGSGAVSVGLGGSGGKGGDSVNSANPTQPVVDLTVKNNVTTDGMGSTGIIAQSLGGGGGNGAFNVSGSFSYGGTGSGAVSVGLGGSGGDGGKSGNVTSDITGNINAYASDASTSKETTGSKGVLVQSVGGGGGSGGLNVSGAIALSNTGAGAVSVGLGGAGGGGGTSGNVSNSLTGNVFTRSNDGDGVTVQSIGGGGGSGGMNVSGTIAAAKTGSGALGVGIGGFGGGGGIAGTVTNTVIGDVQTLGSDAHGVLAQSVGGGGGNGGLNVTANVSVSQDGSGALGIGIGGMGGDGGNAGTVTNKVTGDVQTTGKTASGGVLAQSLGGGGGNGGMNVTGVLTASMKGSSAALGIGVGGFGGGGGNAAAVTNNVTGDVGTVGTFSDAIAGQSIGGSGGNGAMNITGSLNLSKENGGSLGVGIGGFGGKGGNAGTVNSAIASMLISTTGDHSVGVLAQSVGGGGGNGGTNVTGSANITGKNGAAIGVGVGGFGGGGGNADAVTLSVTGEIKTQGEASHGIFAQSLGGGGGNGGTNITGSLAFSNGVGTAKTAAVAIGVGGFGGDGGKADNVSVAYSGKKINAASTVVTNQDGAHGLAAQSVGGGGGDGAVNVSAGLSLTTNKTGDAYGLVFGIGGFGGAGGDAGAVDVKVSKTESITARGKDRAAILAQSLGGGGGNGGLNVTGGISTDSSILVGIGGDGANAGKAGAVSLVAKSDLFAYSTHDPNGKTQNSAAGGIVAQSIGGGGGNGALNVTGGVAIAKESTVPSINVGIGGSGGAGAISGTVTVNHTGNITSEGNWTHGILAQSIAGGGGNGGMNVSGQINFADSKNSGGKTDLTVVVGVGGKGGSAANADAVSVTQNGVITTSGDNSRGILAQSVGGGGGTGGTNITGVLTQSSSPIQVAIGGSGGNGGNAGSVLVNRGTATTATGKITTNGESAHGIEASSFGGGGGDAGMNFNVGISFMGKIPSKSGSAVQVTLGGAGGAASNGSTAAVNNYSDIQTQGDNSHGIIAQSIGGGGGNANINHAYTFANATAGKKENKNLGFSFALGGQVGDGGNSDRVDVVHVGNIQTSGEHSFGVFAQSVGGGGGNADNKTESTFLDFVTGVSGLDVGGPNVSIAIGQKGGTGGNGANVTLSSKGAIATTGKDSTGLFAQSIGGGGGNSTSTTVSGSDGNDNAVSITVGMKGATGGHSGDVTLDAAGSVTTEGDKSHGIFAQSVGGGGGTGGSDDAYDEVGTGDIKSTYDAATSGGAGNSLNISLGGDGGAGGYSGNVKVNSSANISTKGDRSIGILAQSVGGGGGEGGIARTGYVSSGSVVNITVGGKGGTGMYAGDVAVGNSGSIVTDGEISHGILAQSLGGGGGNGGMAISATLLNVSQGDGFIVSAALGGNGGSGGTSGKVNVTNSASGTIYTQKDNSFGILAQSVGGGGGNGAQAIAGTLISSQANRFNLTVGGSGGTGGTSGKVEVINDGVIVTEGKKSHGIVAQSIGGGGGNGGMSIVADMAIGAVPGAGLVGSFAIGGQGGSGNTSGDVTVKNTGAIAVQGDGAYGIYAQSVGGGGGDGGFAAAISTSLLSPNPAAIAAASLMTFGMGGFGGSGANSGNVLVEHSGAIAAYGDNSIGIFAQSVGGGGGKSAYSISSPIWTVADLILKTIVGGGSSGTAGKVTVNTSGDIFMYGKNSQAQLVQEINGGGGSTETFFDFSDQGTTVPVTAEIESEVQLGSSDVSGAAGNDVVATHEGDLATAGDNSAGSSVQSIGGGGGNAMQQVKIGGNTSLDLALLLGAKNTNDSGGGDINLTRTGDVTTAGQQSLGSSVQSIGGGGGKLFVEAQNTSGQAQAMAKLTLGADPSFNNNGGDINETNTGDTATTGDRSPGIIRQSIGAGGGLAQMVGLNSLTVELGASDGSTGNGGLINLTNTGAIATSGVLSHGVILQSIGGGGGFVLTDLDKSQIAINPSANNAGNGGDILFNQTGNVAVGGDRSFGIFAQSLGGGGGLVDDFFADAAGGSGTSGTVKINFDGNLTATGINNIGIFAQSRALGTQGNIDVSFVDNKTIKVNDSGIGVKISGGANNSLTNNGGSMIAATLENHPDGYTVVGEEGNETVLNKATAIFYGNINLGGGVNSFTNEVGAFVFTGKEMFIGGDNQSTFTNAGVISPGDLSIYNTAIAGNYNQTATATMQEDLDFTDDSLDRLNITQNSALEGTMNLYTRGIENIKPGQRNLIFAATGGTITKETINLNVPTSAIVKYSIGSTDKIAFLDINVDFAGFGILNRNETAFGNYLNRVQLAGSSSALAPLIKAIFDLPSSDQLRNPFDSLSPEIYGTIDSNLELTSRQFVDDLFTCKASGKDHRMVAAGECMWLGGSTQGYDGDRTYENFGFNSASSGISAGTQFELADNWFFALAGGSSLYETGSTMPAEINGSSDQAGIALKKSFGATNIGFGVVGGSGEFSTKRNNLFPFNDRVTSQQNASFFGSWLRLSYDFGSQNTETQNQWYVRPMLDFGTTRVKYESFEEQGAGPLSLLVSGGSKAYVMLNPAIEIGGEIKAGSVVIRPTAYLGYTHYLSDPSPSVSARLAGAPANVDPFDVTSLADRDIFSTKAGVEMLFLNGFSMKLGYWGQYSKNTNAQGADFKMSLSF